MTTRHLEALLTPASVAVIGASTRPDSTGATLWRHLLAAQFKGPVFAVNPKYRRLEGQSVFKRVGDLPQAPDLAVVCTGARHAAALLDELGTLGTRAAVVLSALADAAQRQAMLEAARKHGLRLLGPGSLGLLAPHAGLNACLAPTPAATGAIAFVSQSGSLVSAMLDWARARAIGFSHVLALGEHADVDAADLLDLLGSDVRTRAILLYLEDVASPRKFLSAARAAARNKPVIVVRGGHAARQRPGDADAVYDAAIARAGMLRVGTLQQMFLAAETLARFRTNSSATLCILTNGQGAGVMAADAAATAGVHLPQLAEATLDALRPLLVRPPLPGAPLLIGSDAPPERYVQVAQVLLADPAAAALLVIHAPSAAVGAAQVARELLPLAQASPPRLLGCWLGAAAVAEAARVFRHAGIASFATPEEAVSAFSMLVAYRRNQAQLIEAPPSSGGDVPADAAASRALVQRVLGTGREWLDAHEARTLLSAYGIEVMAEQRVEPEPYAAASAAERIGYPVVLQIDSPDVAPSAESGSERWDLRSAVQVRDAARRMLAQLARTQPAARLAGFQVRSMARPAFPRELVAGARIDAAFGPVIVLGSGGDAIDVAAELAVALPPLNLPLAQALLRRTRVRAALRAHGEVPAADEAALLRTLVGLSQLLIDVSQIAEVDLSPLLAGSDGVAAMHARVRLRLDAPAGALNFAIRPYPSHLVEQLVWHGHAMTVRPIRPEDEAQHLDFLGSIAPEDMRLRVFYTRRGIERSELARLTQIDYAREMAFLAVETDADGRERTLGVVRAIAEPDNSSAEFGILIRSDLKGRRLGELLMLRIIDYQRSYGTGKLVATVLAENHRMLELARRLGFVEGRSDEPGTRWIELPLQPGPPAATAAADGAASAEASTVAASAAASTSSPNSVRNDPA